MFVTISCDKIMFLDSLLHSFFYIKALFATPFSRIKGMFAGSAKSCSMNNETSGKANIDFSNSTIFQSIKEHFFRNIFYENISVQIH